jgi:hypothetical protein
LPPSMADTAGLRRRAGHGEAKRGGIERSNSTRDFPRTCSAPRRSWTCGREGWPQWRGAQRRWQPAMAGNGGAATSGDWRRCEWAKQEHKDETELCTRGIGRGCIDDDEFRRRGELGWWRCGRPRGRRLPPASCGGDGWRR